MPRVFVPAILSGVLLWAAFFPLDLGPLGFVALVPWLALVRAPVSRKRRYFAAYVGGFTFFVLAVEWLHVAHPMMFFAWVGLSLVLPLFWVLGLSLIRRGERIGIPLALSVPAAWVALEYARMHFPTGFTFLKPLGLYQMIGFGWYFLGYTQHAFIPLIQVSDLAGVYAISFVVAAINGLAADWVLRNARISRWLRWPAAGLEPASPSRQRLLVATLAVLALVGSTLVYGFVQLDHPPFARGPRVAAIQGSVPQGDKMQKGNTLEATYGHLYGEAIRSSPRPDLIVYPETCFIYDWLEVAPGQKAPDQFAHDAELGEKLFAELPGCFEITDARLAAMRQVCLPPAVANKLVPLKGRLFSLTEAVDALEGVLSADEIKNYRAYILRSTFSMGRVPVLLGLSGIEWENGQEWKYNSALLLDRVGAKVGRYDKMHLVPFGEYVPLGKTFPFLQVFTPYPKEYACRPGEHWTRFPLTSAEGLPYTFACLICYEDSDPYLARQYVASEPVNFFVNISNDGWFDGTEEHEQHLAISRFRAIEARRALVRSVNMGISAAIDSDGRIVALPRETWEASKKVEAVVAADIPIDERESWYARLGDWLPAACWGWVLMILAFGRKKSRLLVQATDERA